MDKLQMLALILEALGLCFAAIEILNERLARSIEKSVFEYLSVPRYFAIGQTADEIEKAEENNESNVAGFFLILLIVSYLASYSMEINHKFLSAFIFSVTFVVLIKHIIRALRKISGGRALGGAGLLLAFTGIAIETVQVWVIPKKAYAVIVVGVALLITFLCTKKS